MFRGADYEGMRVFHDKDPLRRLERDYFEAARGATKALPTERLAWLYFFTMLDHIMALRRVPAHEQPTAAIWWDELKHSGRGAMMPPPATPAIALGRAPAGMHATMVRLMRRHYLVARVRQQPLVVRLSDDPIEALVAWMGAVSPGVYPEARLPEQLWPWVHAMRS